MWFVLSKQTFIALVTSLEHLVSLYLASEVPTRSIAKALLTVSPNKRRKVLFEHSEVLNTEKNSYLSITTQRKGGYLGSAR